MSTRGRVAGRCSERRCGKPAGGWWCAAEVKLGGAILKRRRRVKMDTQGRKRGRKRDVLAALLLSQFYEKSPLHEKKTQAGYGGRERDG